MGRRIHIHRPNCEKRFQYTAQDGRCFLCNRTMLMKGHIREFGVRTGGVKDNYATWDHVVPLSKGGTDDASNRVLVCNKCNYEKDDLTLKQHQQRTAERAAAGAKLRGGLG